MTVIRVLVAISSTLPPARCRPMQSTISQQGRRICAREHQGHWSCNDVVATTIQEQYWTDPLGEKEVVRQNAKRLITWALIQWLHVPVARRPFLDKDEGSVCSESSSGTGSRGEVAATSSKGAIPDRSVGRTRNVTSGKC